MDANVCREHLDELLTEEASALATLETLLDREHEYLTANDIDALDRAGEERQACVTALVRIEDERRSLCRMMNVPADPSGLERLLAWCDPSRLLQRRWASCADHAGRCRNLNERNGALVAARLKKVEGLLGIITGRANQPQIYASKGGYDVSGRGARVLASV